MYPLPLLDHICPSFDRTPYHPLTPLTNSDNFKNEYSEEGCTSPANGANRPRAEHPADASSCGRFSPKNDGIANNLDKISKHERKPVTNKYICFLINGIGEPEHRTIYYQARATRGAVLGASLSGRREHTRTSKDSQRRQHPTAYEAASLCPWLLKIKAVA